MSSIFDVTFNGKSLYTDYELRVLSYVLDAPDPKLYRRQIPGTSDIVDLSEIVSGDVEYNMRGFTIRADFRGTAAKYFPQYSKIMNDLHGRKFDEIIFSWDKGFKWNGHVFVKAVESVPGYGHVFEISAEVDPFKKEVYASTEPWDWDSLDFDDGIIREYYDLPVPGTLIIPGRRRRVVPIITASNNMSVTYLGNTYDLFPGENLITALYLGEGEHTLTFNGTGTVDVLYEGAQL